jgi:hypothetical protein
MTADGAATRGPWGAIELSSAELGVTLLPDKGCDVLELVHLESGVDVLLNTSWDAPAGDQSAGPSSSFPPTAIVKTSARRVT